MTEVSLHLSWLLLHLARGAARAPSHKEVMVHKTTSGTKKSHKCPKTVKQLEATVQCHTAGPGLDNSSQPRLSLHCRVGKVFSSTPSLHY